MGTILSLAPMRGLKIRAGDVAPKGPERRITVLSDSARISHAPSGAVRTDNTANISKQFLPATTLRINSHEPLIPAFISTAHKIDQCVKTPRAPVTTATLQDSAPGERVQFNTYSKHSKCMDTLLMKL